MGDMKRMQFGEIRQEFTRVLLALGLENSKARRCAEIFAENTRDGIASHGLNFFPNFVEIIKAGIVDIQVEPELVSSFGVIEQWDGKRGVGPLNAEKAMKRAIEISCQHGIGCVGLGNTNHWMRAGTYGLQAAETGRIGVCWTNTTALMPPWGAAEKKIGNNPIVFCIPRKEGPVLLDIAMSQFSFGKLEIYRRRGEMLPLAGGHTEDGELTIDPGAILKSGRALPIGYWKGSGLALVLDLMAVLITGGDSTREISRHENETGVSQVFMAIDIASQMGASNVERKVNAVIEDFLDVASFGGASKVRYPGQGFLDTRKENLEKGILVDPEVWQKILKM